MSRNAFPGIERDYIRQQGMAEIAREERKESMSESDELAQFKSKVGKQIEILRKHLFKLESENAGLIMERDALKAEVDCEEKRFNDLLDDFTKEVLECDALQTKLDAAQLNEREGWRYAGELEQERKELQAKLESAPKPAAACASMQEELEKIKSELWSTHNIRQEKEIKTLQAKLDSMQDELDKVTIQNSAMSEIISHASGRFDRIRELVDDGTGSDTFFLVQKKIMGLQSSIESIKEEYALCRKRLMALVEERDALQAKLDSLMLEHCPEEMTPEQTEEWGKHQKPVRAAAPKPAEVLEGCICKGNWQNIIKEYSPLFGKKYLNRDEEECIFVGVLWADDDFYYSMQNLTTSKSSLLSCVGSIEGFGYALKKEQP